MKFFFSSCLFLFLVCARPKPLQPSSFVLLLLSAHSSASTLVASLPVLGGLQLGAVLTLLPVSVSIVMAFRTRWVAEY